MNVKHFFKAAIVAIIILASFIAGLEYYWRSKGYQLSYNDDKMFWADVRRKVYEPADRATVFIGSSRMKWDIDTETWEKLTGEKAIQLALVGTSPRKILLDLANDEKFAGKLIMDIMEPLNFVPIADTIMTERFAREALDYYYNETPAQRGSTMLGLALESKFVLLEEGKFGLNQVFIERSQENNRTGVRPTPIPFRKEYVITTSSRQNRFSPVFLDNPQLVEEHKAHWIKDMWGRRPVIAAKNAGLDSICLIYKNAFEKIKSRGGTVMLIRPPSNGVHLDREVKIFPRKQYWDYLLQYSDIPGIHYADYPATAGMICTEDSHLNPGDAVKYTESLVNTLKSEYGWKFPTSKQP
jgi:hypothetical protein